ncbi:DUF2510 domain-containing protein [Microbacterium sp. CFBP9034]|uniref:DUF2510 domain-containing protein n=1 Tax=Microbacterium sp. CFBP9034 TaxID=3096540 RepID=UPI002A6B24A5|nr:DUF2510 domain-containing protein [Microbacterium sp. CFBP9034]MDY0910680.1 DUF2510 domain-containing protein [Microbacterium sp. CFBP9034]
MGRLPLDRALHRSQRAGHRAARRHVGAGERSGEQGWYDDGRGRRRWWDGARWTDAVRYSGEEQSLGGIVVDGRWIHYGASSHPVAGAVATQETGAELLRRGRLAKPATARTLLGPAGPITPHLLRRSVSADARYLLVEVAGEVWLATVPPGQDAAARQFTSWVNSVSEHYRYR